MKTLEWTILVLNGKYYIAIVILFGTWIFLSESVVSVWVGSIETIIPATLFPQRKRWTENAKKEIKNDNDKKKNHMLK
jgi:hypothetical protein